MGGQVPPLNTGEDYAIFGNLIYNTALHFFGNYLVSFVVVFLVGVTSFYLSYHFV